MFRLRVGATLALTLLLLVGVLAAGAWARHQPPMNLGPAITVTPMSARSSAGQPTAPSTGSTMNVPTRGTSAPLGAAAEPAPHGLTPTATQPVRTSSSPVPIAPPKPQPEKPIGAEPASKPPVPPAGTTAGSDVMDNVEDDDEDGDDG